MNRSSDSKFKWIRFIFLAMMVTAVTLIAVSILYRLQKGKPIFMPRFADVDFKETWRSGRSDRRFSSNLSEASGILWIVVVQDRLQVSPHFPFTLAFIAEALGWDHVVPGKSILDVRRADSATGPGTVKIRYRHMTGDEETLHLVVQDRKVFVAALTKIRRN